MCYLIRLENDDGGQVYHIIKKNFRVDTAPEIPFDSEVSRTDAVAVETPTRAGAGFIFNEREDEEHISDNNVEPSVGGSRFTRDDIVHYRNQGIEVDDDNEPAPENAEPPAPTDFLAPTFRRPLFCVRKMEDIPDKAGKWNSYSCDKIAKMSEVDLFRMAFPEEFIFDVIIPATNERLCKPTTLREFYVWLGCHFYMACHPAVSNREMWWAKEDPDMFSGAPFWLEDYMTKTRFLEMSKALQFTNLPPPTSFTDRFHDVHQMINAFNDHYASEYNPSWINCLDELMSSWMNQFCPGFMFGPRKPHPFGNEYHTIADGDGGKPVMWRVKLQEGKDRPKKEDKPWAFPSPFEPRFSKTSVLMLEMTKPIHATGRVVTMDSGFCVTEGILALHEFGVFGQALIKKRGRYWPKGVPGDRIEAHFEGKELGYTETLVQLIDGQRFMVRCMRDTEWVTKIMTTFGMLTEVEDHTTWRKVDGEWRSFKYTEPFSRHNRSKHWVDDVNNRRHDPVGLEEVWRTKWWPFCQFCFLCSVAEVNAVNSQARARRCATMPQLDFRTRLAKGLLNNRLNDYGVHYFHR